MTKSKYISNYVPNKFVFLLRRTLIINILQCLYGLTTKKNLPIYDIPEKDLRGYTTTEKNKKQ